MGNPEKVNTKCRACVTSSRFAFLRRKSVEVDR